MRSARDGEAGFVELYRQYYWDVLLYARRRVDEETARDVVAETFLVALRRPGAVPDRPLPWLYGVARHVLANEIRARGRRERLSRRVEAAAAGGVPTVQQDPGEEIADRHQVRRALARLSPRDQETLQLIAWEELDIAQAAQVVECSVTAFTVRLHRARRRLARLLDHEASATHQSRGPIRTLPRRCLREIRHQLDAAPAGETQPGPTG